MSGPWYSNLIERVERDGDPVVCVKLVVCVRHDIATHHQVDFSPILPVSKLKDGMAVKLLMAADDQVWKHNGRVIHDYQTLNDVGVDPDDTIEVTRRAP